MENTYQPEKISITDYLQQESLAAEKHEYYRGDVYAMSGGSINHNKICGNLFTNL